METSQLAQQTRSVSLWQQYRKRSLLFNFFYYGTMPKVALVSLFALCRCWQAKSFDAKERHALVAIHSVAGAVYFFRADASHLWTAGIFYALTGVLLYAGSVALSWREPDRTHRLFLYITDDTKEVR